MRKGPHTLRKEAGIDSPSLGVRPTHFNHSLTPISLINLHVRVIVRVTVVSQLVHLSHHRL